MKKGITIKVDGKQIAVFPFDKPKAQLAQYVADMEKRGYDVEYIKADRTNPACLYCVTREVNETAEGAEAPESTAEAHERKVKIGRLEISVSALEAAHNSGRYIVTPSKIFQICISAAQGGTPYLIPIYYADIGERLVRRGYAAMTAAECNALIGHPHIAA